MIKLIIADKNGEKKEIDLDYMLKDGDKIQKINGKWYLIKNNT